MSRVCPVDVDVSVSVIAVITTIITTVAIIAVVVISSALAPFDLHGLALAARGARVERRHMACGVTSGCGAKRMGGHPRELPSSPRRAPIRQRGYRPTTNVRC